jgi:hypothetical protein
MSKLARVFVDRYLNGGTALVLMGVQWLYLWLFPWYHVYVADPRWGHNYTSAIAFLAVGLAYFNRRLASSILAFLAALLIIPSSLELIPHPATAIAGAVLMALIIIDIFVERKRDKDLCQPADDQRAFWLKKHLLRFSYLMLASMAVVYFLVRFPLGTYEVDIDTIIYDAMLLPFIVLLLLEDMPGIVDGVRMKRLGFFWGMITMIAVLVLMFDEPETWPIMAFTIIVTAIGIVAWVMAHRPVR